MYLSKIEQAVDCFDSGYNCAQAIASTYCEELGLDREAALLASTGFGGGMGRLQGTCGALTGAYLLIGLKYGMTSVEHPEDKDNTYALVRQFEAAFRELNQVTSCRELLGVDLLNGDEQLIAERHDTVCPKVIRDSARIIEQMLFS